MYLASLGRQIQESWSLGTYSNLATVGPKILQSVIEQKQHNHEA